MDRYQLFIKTPTFEFIPLGPPAPAVDANLWYQLLLAHFGSDEVRLEIAKRRPAMVTARSVWPGEE